MTSDEFEELVGRLAPHDLHKPPGDASKVELDEEDIHDLLIRTHVILSQLLERKLPDRLKNDLISLVQDVEDGLAWYRTNG